MKTNNDLLRELLGRDPDLADVPDAVPKLVRMMILRDQELNTPPAPRGTIAWYFRTDSADDARKALYAAVPTLLRAWLAQQGSDDE